jgi:hypothetical protein
LEEKRFSFNCFMYVFETLIKHIIFTETFKVNSELIIINSIFIDSQESLSQDTLSEVFQDMQKQQ